MTSTPEQQRTRLVRARTASWITLGAFVVVAVLSVVLAARGGSSPLLLVIDALGVFITVRSALRLRTVGAALRDLEE